MITCLALAHIFASRTHHLFPCTGWVGWVGWGGMITCVALAHIPAEHITCTHARGGWGGWGGWDDTVQRQGQRSLASPKIRQGNSFKGKNSLYLKGASFWVGAPSFCMLSTPLRDKWSACYSVLQSTTPVRLLFYKVLLQDDCANIALVRTIYKVLLGTSKTYSVLPRSTN